MASCILSLGKNSTERLAVCTDVAAALSSDAEKTGKEKPRLERHGTLVRFHVHAAVKAADDWHRARSNAETRRAAENVVARCVGDSNKEFGLLLPRIVVAAAVVIAIAGDACVLSHRREVRRLKETSAWKRKCEQTQPQIG